MLEFIGILKKKTFGLVNVVAKDKNGAKVTDMGTAIVDTDEDRPGIQEGKDWLAMVEYLKKMKDQNGDGIPDLEQKYFKPVVILIPVNK